MERMAVTASTGVMSSLLSKLSLLLSDKYKQLKGVRRDDIESLSRELTDMNAALVMLEDREKLNVQTKVWRDKVREMAYDIEDIIDIFMHHYDQAEDDKDGLLQKTARKIMKLRARFQIAGMIQDIKARVEEQSQSRDRYKVEEFVSESRVVEVDPRLLAMYEDAKWPVGIDGPREEIIKQLMEEDDSKPGRLKVQSIVGFGGLGKTTLASQVYAKIRNEFDCTAFISVSRTPHMPKILKDILSQVGYVGLEVEDDVPKLIGILRAKLTNKRYFVIIDDLWCINDWQTIECAFVENNNASRVITTTRIQHIGMTCCLSSQGHVYQMPPLNELHSRRLFFKRLFDTEDSCPEQFREISDQMLRKCKGVPLAITSTASLLANNMQVKIWKEIHNSLGSQLDTNPTLQWMRHVLSLGYNDLSHELKTCLLYLGMYLKDRKIPKKALVTIWIALGLVREKQGLDLEEAAENCFNELINRSMIQPCFNENGYGEVSACEIHDLMRDLIILKYKEQENFITVIDEKYPMNAASQVRRISHQFHDKDMPQTVESMCASTVRSYTFFPLADCIPPLSKYEYLTVLDLQRSFSVAPMCLDLSAINHLFLLRHVRVQNFDIQLPKKFGKLKHLMTLDMSQSWSSSEQISDFSSLSSLEHLNLPGPVTFKNGLSKLCNLYDLSCFDIGSNSMECIRDLGESTNLRSLHVTYSCSREDDIENNPKMQILAASLNKLGNSDLRHLDLFFQSLTSATAPSAQFWSNCLTCPRNLQSLSLHCPLMPKLPNWIAYADTLAHAVLLVQELRSDDVQVLAQLPCLIYLQLRAKTIPENNIIIHPNTFHSLESFKFFCGVPCLTFEPEAMPRLRMLEIQFDACEQGAMQLHGVIPFSGIEHLASLEEIFFVIHGKSNQWSKLESACRDAISRHPKSQAMKIAVSHEEEEMAVALTAIVQSHPSRPNYSLNRVGTCVADKQILCDSSQHSQAVASDVIPLELLKQTTSDLPDEQKHGTGDFGIVYKGDHANGRQRLNIGDTTSGLDETENNNMKSDMTSASENDDDNNAGGEDEIKFFGSEQTDFRDQECNTDDDTHDGEDNMEFGIEQPTEGDHADRRQSLNIGDITSGLDETENQSAPTFASENDGDTNAGGEEEIMLFGGAETDITDQECNADDDSHDGQDNMEFGIAQPTEGEMSATLGIIEFPTSSSLGTMGPLLQKLDLLLDSKTQLIRRSAKETIKLLKEDLQEINADLVELSMVERPNYKTRYWMHEVRELTYHIEDFIDNMVQSGAAAKAKVIFSGRRPQLWVRRHVKILCLPKTVKPFASLGLRRTLILSVSSPLVRHPGFLKRFSLSWRHESRHGAPLAQLHQALLLIRPPPLSERIAELRTMLWEASERHERYQLQDSVSSEPRFLFPWNSHAPALSSTSSGAGADLVGVDGTRGKLTSWLIDQTEEEHWQLQVLSIIGPAGVGKTALVKELYRQLGHQFECRAFVRVSRNPDMRRLLVEILAQVQGRKRDYENEAASTADNVMDSIRSHLQDKRYFVVIDELWDAAAWDIMNISFPKGNNCSRIIITAEGKDVASKCYYVHNLEMTPLGSVQDSAKIFVDRVFGSEHQCPDQLKDISCMIIRSCGGFPLAITTVASLLASQIHNTELWDYLQQCFVSRLTGVKLEETCKEVVNICYDALPQNLKTCLLYLTMYPEGSTIRKADLLNQWISEGFITPKEGNQKVVESYFAELISRGMIQPEKVSHDDEVLSCTVHHIVFEVIAQKSREENFITAVDYSQVMPVFSMIAHRLTLHYSCAQFAAKPEGLKLSQVRSLAFYGLLKCMPSITEFKFLRVLILEFWGNNYHHNSSLDLSKLCILFHLRYLKISSHIFIVLPSQIRRIQSLETLEIDAQVSSVPTDIFHLPGLLHLSLPNGAELPDGIGRITSLQTLEYFDLGSNSEDNAKSLGELINLQNLHVTCSKAVSDHHLKRNLVALSSSIGKLANLKSLRVGPFAVGMTMFIDQDDMPCAPKLLERLKLSPSSFIFSRLPTWIGALQKLCILKIAIRVLLSSDIDTLTGLPVLAVLSLYVQKPNAGSVIFNSGSLPALKYFKYRCAALRLAFQKEALPNLQRLKLCFNVHSAESYTSNLAGIENLLQLKEITAEIGAAAGAHELDMWAAESALKEATWKHPRFPIHMNVKNVDCIEEESTPVGFMHPIPYILGFLALAVVVVVLAICMWCFVV